MISRQRELQRPMRHRCTSAVVAVHVKAERRWVLAVGLEEEMGRVESRDRVEPRDKAGFV